MISLFCKWNFFENKLLLVLEAAAATIITSVEEMSWKCVYILAMGGGISDF